MRPYYGDRPSLCVVRLDNKTFKLYFVNILPRPILHSEIIKIDGHAHIMPSHWPSLAEKYGYKGFIQLKDDLATDTKDMYRDDGVFFRKVSRNCWDPTAILKDMDKYKVDMMLLCTIPVLFNYWAKAEDASDWCMFLNDHLCNVQNEYPNRFMCLGTLPMQDSKLAVKELERIAKLGMLGVEIGSNIDGVNLDDKSLFPVYEAAENLNMSIFVHPWNMMGEKEMTKYWLPWLVGMPAEESRAICSMIFGGVFDRFPKLRVMFAHGGGSFALTLGRIAHGYTCRPDLVNINNVMNPKSYMGKFWVDGITHDTKALQYIMDTFGMHKVVYGTDYPFPLGDLEHGKFIETDNSITAQQKKNLFKNNILEFLNLAT